MVISAVQPSQTAFGYANGVEWDVRYEVRTAANSFVRDITDDISSCVIDVDPDKDVVGTAKLTITRPLALDLYEDFIAPVVMLSYPDRATYWEFPMGLFQARPGPTTWDYDADDGWNATGQVTFDDLTGILNREKLADDQNITTNTNRVTAALSLINAATLPNGIPWRTNIPATTLRVPKTVTLEAGQTRISAVTEMLNAANLYKPWADTSGALRSFLYRDFDHMTPSVTYQPGVDDRIITDAVKITTNPDDTNLANRITVLQPDTDPLKRFKTVYENRIANSPSRIGGPMGLRSRFVQVSGYETQAAVSKYALELVAKWGSLYETIAFETNLEPLHEPHELIAIDLGFSARSGDVSERLAGRWIQAGYSHDLNRGRTTIRGNRYIAFDKVSEGLA